MLNISFHEVFGKLNKDVGYCGLYTTTPEESHIPDTKERTDRLSALIVDYYGLIDNAYRGDMGILLLNEDEVFIRTFYQAFKRIRVPSLAVIVNDDTSEGYIDMLIELGDAGVDLCIIRLKDDNDCKLSFPTSMAVTIHAASKIVDRMFIYHTQEIGVEGPDIMSQNILVTNLGYYAALASINLLSSSDCKTLVVSKYFERSMIKDKILSNSAKDLVTDEEKSKVEELLKVVETEDSITLNLNLFINLPSYRANIPIERNLSLVRGDINTFEKVAGRDSLNSSPFQSIYESVLNFY